MEEDREFIMHRWHFQRLFRWFIPVFVFIVSLCALIAWQKAVGVGLTFLDDHTYADFAVARNFAEQWAYAIHPEQLAPAVYNVVWRLALALTTVATANESAAAYLLGAICCLTTILLALKLLNRLFPFPPFIVYSAILLILAPPFLLDAVDQPSMALSTALLMAACLLHMEGLSEDGVPLPMRSALLVGLLMWVRLEFVILWIVFFLHAIVITLFNRARSPGLAFVVVRGLTGLCLLALCLFPLLAWNFHVLQVPWPQAMGAPLVMDQCLSAGPAEAVRSYFAMVRDALPEALHQVYVTPFLSGFFERVLVWFGVVFITGLALWRPEERPYTLILFLLILMPVGYALIYPFVGWPAAIPVFSAWSPLCLISASFGIFRIPFLVESLYRKWKQGLPAPSGFRIWWIAMGSVLLLVCLARSVSQMNDRNTALIARLDSRAVVSEAIQSGAIQGHWIVTDQPGWLAYTHRAQVVDLSGEFSPQVIACLGNDGKLDLSELGTYLAGERIDSMVIWTSGNEMVSSLIPCEPIMQNAARKNLEWPKICAISPSGVF